MKLNQLEFAILVVIICFTAVCLSFSRIDMSVSLEDKVNDIARRVEVLEKGAKK